MSASATCPHPPAASSPVIRSVASASAAGAGPRVTVPIAVAPGDGVGPEIMDATLRVLAAAGARLDVATLPLGQRVYEAGHPSGIAAADLAVVRSRGVLLKGPVTTPQGGGFKSVNVTIRKSLGLFANVRPVSTYHPFVPTQHPGMEVVIVRENEEDLYAGIEHRQTQQVTQCLKLITRPGCERVVRYAFEYAVRNGRRKVTCVTKDNIMKMTDGLFRRVFEEVGAEYPQILQEHRIVDIGAAKLAAAPGQFDVIVTPNLYGDVLSDVAAEVAGSVGLAPSANVGERVAMFEAIHGSAPDIAGQGVANPSGLLLAAVMMLVHVGQGEVAARVHNAWLATIEAGDHTADVHRSADGEDGGGASRRRLGTAAFADAVISRLGRTPAHLPAVAYAAGAPEPIRVRLSTPVPQVKTLVGVDVFLDWSAGTPEVLAQVLAGAANAPEGDGAGEGEGEGGGLALQMITNRGVKVWPAGVPETGCTDHWRCRFKPRQGGTIASADVVALLGRVASAGFDFIKTEHLYDFDGVPGYALGQGQ